VSRRHGVGDEGAEVEDGSRDIRVEAGDDGSVHGTT
jgi:hypothetical protein